MKSTNLSFKNALSYGVGLSALIWVPMHAAIAQQDEDGTSRLDTITVTAQKREQTLQDVPVAVSVTSAETINEAQIIDIIDLQSVVPSFRVSQLEAAGNTSFIIRGFGNGANNIGLEPSVGVFIDGVYRSRSAGVLADLPSLERVEILRGPQSTLFGKNASAGIVSVVTAAPSFEQSAMVSATLGNYDQVILKGEATDTLIENKLAGSISGYHNRRAGFFEDVNRGTDIGDRYRYGLRGQLLFTPTDNIRIRGIADFDRIQEKCCGVVNLYDASVNGFPASGPGAVRALGGQFISEAPFSYDVALNKDPNNKIRNSGYSVQTDINFDKFDFTSITAYRDTYRFEDYDADFTTLDIFETLINDSEIETFTQEFRLTSNTDGRVDWLLGAFLSDETIEQEVRAAYGQDFYDFVNVGSGGTLPLIESLIGVPTRTLFPRGSGETVNFKQDNQAYSIFGQLDFNLTDRLTLTAGLNYTSDEKDVVFRSVNTDPIAAIDNPAFQALQFIPLNVEFPNAVEDGNTSDNDTTWTLRAAYDLTDSINIYASASTGFKASSWNLTRDSRPVLADANALLQAGLLSYPFITGSAQTIQPAAFGTRFAGPEESEVFEIGLKAQFDNLAFNVTVFEQTIDNFQSALFIGTGFALANAEEQVTTGVEFDATWAPFDSLTLNAAGTFLDPQYEGEFLVNVTSAPYLTNTLIDLDGQTPAGISETNLTFAGTYRFNLSDEWSAYIRADHYYESDVQINDNITGLNRETNTTNAAMGMENQEGLSFQVWGRNIFDDETNTSNFPAPAQDGAINGYNNAPATYGVTVTKRF